MSLTRLIAQLEAHGYGLYVRRSDATLEAGALPLTAIALAIMAHAVEERPEPVTDGEKAVDKMVQDIMAPDSKINRSGRAKIRQACDKKDAPPTGKPAADSAVGRISRGW